MKLFCVILLLLFSSATFSQDAWKDKVICGSGSIEIGEDGNLCYSWKAVPADPNLSNPKTAKITVTPSQTTVYTRTAIGQDFSSIKTDQVKVSVLDINLTISSTITTMCQGVTFTAKTSLTGISIKKYKFEIRPDALSTWYTMYEGTSDNYTRNLKVGGKFKVRATLKTDEVECSSKEESIEVQFPSYSDITSNATMSTAFNNAWQNTLNATTPTSRREEGFWILINTNTCAYSASPTILGPTLANNATGSVNLGSRPVNSPANPSPIESATYTIGSFHTHTPTTYRLPPLVPPGVRAVGPSNADQSADTADDVVGVVYDYISASGEIPMGYPLNSPAGLYHSGPNRRTKP